MPRWLKITLIVFGSTVGLLVVVVGVLLTLFALPKYEDLGGNWALGRFNTLAIESGPHHTTLARKRRFRNRVVADDPFPYKYLGDDCMTYMNLNVSTWTGFVVCGDRPPIRFARFRHMENWNLLETDPVEIGAQRFSWSDLKRHANAGEPFPIPD